VREERALTKVPHIRKGKETLLKNVRKKGFDAQGNPKGIGLSIWRFYISAGTTEQGEASDGEAEGVRVEWHFHKP